MSQLSGSPPKIMKFLRTYLFITYEEDTTSFYFQSPSKLYFLYICLSWKQFYRFGTALILQYAALGELKIKVTNGGEIKNPIHDPNTRQSLSNQNTFRPIYSGATVPVTTYVYYSTSRIICLSCISMLGGLNLLPA